MKCSYGYFHNEGREFVVTEPGTPRAWVNYMWNDRFISCVSHHGAGEGAYRERTIQYIDERGRNFMVRDERRCFYLRDAESGEVWSPGWHPVQRELEEYQCVHGLGYSVIESKYGGIEARFRVFVPVDQPCEIWTITLRNTRETAVKVQCYSFVDWLLMGYPRYCDYFATLFGQWHEDINAVQCCNRAAERTHEVYDGFVASDMKASGYDTSRRAFVGAYGHYQCPEAVKAGRMSNSLASCEYMVGALEHTIELGAGEERTLNVFIGASSGVEMTREIVGRYFEEGAVERAFARLCEKKGAMVDRLTIDTPNKRIDYLVNCWMKQQIQIYADVGSDNGRGFRDAMQLLWATASYDEGYTRRMIVECLSHQYGDGHTLRGWLPVDDHHYSDGPVWIAPVVDAYLKESGDYGFLDEPVKFYDGGEATVWEHVLRGLRHCCEDVGAHGMTRMHFGDWNDSLTGIGVEGRGESVWVSMGIVYGLKIAAKIARAVRHDEGTAEELRGRAEKLTGAINAHGWDGEYYLRAINDYGEKVGTHTEKEGRVYLLPQVWAKIAGVADEEREGKAFRAVDEMLECDHGCLVQWPTYTKKNERIGRITGMVPGIWENGTAYSHANGFKLIADCMAGRTEEAYRTFCKVMPDSRWNPSTHSGCEPYVMTNQVLGPENGRAGWSPWGWMTGASAWFYRAMTEWMIGVRASYEGLVIEPSLPREWGGARIVRNFRGARYEVRVSDPMKLGRGRVRVEVDGREIEGNVVPMFEDGGVHEVRVTIEKGDEAKKGDEVAKGDVVKKSEESEQGEGRCAAGIGGVGV